MGRRCWPSFARAIGTRWGGCFSGGFTPAFSFPLRFRPTTNDPAPPSKSRLALIDTYRAVASPQHQAPVRAAPSILNNIDGAHPLAPVGGAAAVLLAQADTPASSFFLPRCRRLE